MFVSNGQKVEELFLVEGFLRLSFYAFPFEIIFPNFIFQTHQYKEYSCISFQHLNKPAQQ